MPSQTRNANAHANAHANKTAQTERAQKKAAEGIALLEEAIVELLQVNKGGLRNSDVGGELGIRFSKGFVTWELLQRLVARKTLRRDGRKYYA